MKLGPQHQAHIDRAVRQLIAGGISLIAVLLAVVAAASTFL